MKKIYCKASSERRKKFQIYTSLIEENGKRFAVKEAIYPEGLEHIEQIERNYDMLERIYKEKVATCRKEENKIYFPFVYGETYGSYLCEKIGRECSLDELKEALEEWKLLLIGSEENVVAFDNSSQFKKMFGDGSDFNGTIALQITNFDCIDENIIISDQGIRLIDYEWVFDFPIPLEFTFYRVLKIFYSKNKGVMAFEDLLKMADITDTNSIQVYEKMLDNFHSYITFEPKDNIDYAKLGKLFTVGRILQEGANLQMKYVFPSELLQEEKRLIIYGAGEVGLSYYHYVKSSAKYKLVEWVDKRFEHYRRQGFEVSPIESIKKVDFDYILIGIYNEDVVYGVINVLESYGVDKRKIVWTKPKFV